MQGSKSRRSLSASAAGLVLWVPRQACKDMLVWFPCTRDMLALSGPSGSSSHQQPPLLQQIHHLKVWLRKIVSRVQDLQQDHRRRDSSSPTEETALEHALPGDCCAGS